MTTYCGSAALLAVGTPKYRDKNKNTKKVRLLRIIYVACWGKNAISTNRVSNVGELNIRMVIGEVSEDDTA